MDVNTDIWGLPATWVDGTTAEQNADIKYPATNKDTYKEQYTTGGIPYNEIDLSLAFWGIGKDCIFCNPQYLAPYCVGGDINTIDVYQEPVKQTKTEQPALFCHGDQTTVSISYTRRWSYYTASEIEADVQHRIPQGSAYTHQLYAAMNYQKMMLIPYVETVADTYTTGSYSTYTLYDYVENQRYDTKQRIVGIGFMARYGDGINDNRSAENKYTSLLFSFDVPGKDVSYNSKQFYAHDTGMSYLSWSDGSGGCRIPMSINTARISGNATIGTADTGFRAKYCPTNDGTSVPWYFYDPDDPIWTISKATAPGSGSTVFWYAYPYIAVNSTNAETVKEYVLKQIAYLGLPFVYDPADAARGRIGNIGVYLPVFDENGVTTGEYKEGADALRLPNSEWTDGREGAGYDPGRRENDDFGYLFNPHNTNRFATGLTVWCMYQQDILDVLSGINNLYLTDPDGNSKWQLDFKGSNPDDYIVSCKAMLLDVAHTDTTSAFKLGPVPFDGIACYKYNDTGYFSFGSIDINAYYGDFRDCQPYTSMELYIPLCGTVDIDPEYFTGHSMEIIMMYDVYTGACTAGIYRDHYTLYKAVNGQIGADIPVSALQMGTYQSTVHALQAAQKQNEIRLAASAVTVAAGAAALIAAPATGGASLIAGAGLISGAAGLLGGVMQEQNYDYQIEHTQPVPAQTTAAETQNNFCVGGLYPILYIKRAKMLSSYDAEIYSHTIGNACLINGYVGSQTGLVMCSAVDLSGVPATVEEINAIKQALGKGVYV